MQNAPGAGPLAAQVTASAAELLAQLARGSTDSWAEAAAVAAQAQLLHDRAAPLGELASRAYEDAVTAVGGDQEVGMAYARAAEPPLRIAEAPAVGRRIWPSEALSRPATTSGHARRLRPPAVARRAAHWWPRGSDPRGGSERSPGGREGTLHLPDGRPHANLPAAYAVGMSEKPLPEEEPLPAWSLPTDAVKRIELPEAWPGQVTREWAWGGATGAGVRVCVLDSGVELDHPDVGTVDH